MLLTQIVRIPAAGVDEFQQFEVHLVSFPTQVALDAYLIAPERVAALPLLRASGAVAELVEVLDVTG